MLRSLSVVVLLLVLSCALPSISATAHAAQDDGVRIDPNSPPATEYELPLDAARGTGAGPPAADGAPPPAFGSGITPRPDVANAGARGSGGKNATRTPGTGAASSGLRDPRGDDEAAGARTDVPASSIDGDGSPALYSLGGTLAVLVAGGLVALTLRRRQSTA